MSTLTAPRPPRGPWAGLVLLAGALLAVLLGGDPRGTAGTNPPVSVAFDRTITGFSWPLVPPHPVLRPFQPPATPYGPGHRGVDLGGQAGQAVLAAGDGLVRYAGPLADREVVSIEHVGGLRTTYEPVHPVVRTGQRVSRGQVVGYLLPGHPHCPLSDGPPAVTACLHWGARRGREYLNPLRLVQSGRIRLLPWLEGY